MVYAATAVVGTQYQTERQNGLPLLPVKVKVSGRLLTGCQMSVTRRPGESPTIDMIAAAVTRTLTDKLT